MRCGQLYVTLQQKTNKDKTMKAKITILLLLIAVNTNAEVEWFDGKSPVTYSLPKKVEPVVEIALNMWKSDMQQVTGLLPVASTKPTIKIVPNVFKDLFFISLLYLLLR